VSRHIKAGTRQRWPNLVGEIGRLGYWHFNPEIPQRFDGQLAANTRMSGFLHLMPEHSVAARHVRALVVSSELEVRKPLLRSLQRLQLDTIVCADLREAQEALSEHFVGVVFCDDRLPDGSYSDLLCLSRSRSKASTDGRHDSHG